MEGNSDGLKSIQVIPERFRSLFTAYPCFNRVQSTVLNDILYSTSSVVVTAPTGAGKTALFEIALVKLLMDSSDIKNVKAVYVAPVKALCSERYQDWAPKFEKIGVSCIEITGDTSQQEDIHGHQLILTTPEKWDSLTRRWRDENLIQTVKLFMIDEVHLLSEPKRGPTLEAIVCRMKTFMKFKPLDSSIRFIAVSATIVNLEDLAKWLSTDQPARFHRFGNEMRPVALKRVVRGFPMNKTPYLFDIQLSYKLKQIILEYSEGKPVLIFSSTRRGVSQTCKTLLEQVTFTLNAEQRSILTEVALRLDDTKLRDFVRSGAGCHHAGMSLNDRTLMQDTFMRGYLPVLVATSTLAMGVNLPAHLVVIKSTHQYLAGRIVEYPEASILQMVGRAGRPQFDTSATAVIMTRSDMVKRYTDLLDCKEVLESSLHLNLTEHLNSEIVLGTIKDLSVAMEWLRCTFLFERSLKNPRRYGFTEVPENPAKLEKDLELMMVREFNSLQRSGLVELNENGMDISPTDDGRLMSHYYISFETFKLFFEVKPDFSIASILKTLCEASELNEVQLRVTERRTLNQLNDSKVDATIRYPFAGKVKTRELKIQCLVQACLGCLSIPDPSLQQEALRIVHSLERITKCLTEYLSRKTTYCSLLSSVVLNKCLHAKLWENSIFVARQLEKIGPMLGLCLVNAGKTSFEALMETHPLELERIMKRSPPFGKNVIDQVRNLPKYRLDVKVLREGVLKAQVVVSVDIENKEDIGSAANSTAGMHHAVAIIIGDSSNRLIKYRRVLDRSLFENPVNIQAAVSAPMPRKVFIHLVSEQWVGLDIMRDLFINPMAPSKIVANDYLRAMEPKMAGKGKKQEKAQPSQSKKASQSNPKKAAAPLKRTLDREQTSQGIGQHKASSTVCCFDIEPDVLDLSPEAEVYQTGGACPSNSDSPSFRGENKKESHPHLPEIAFVHLIDEGIDGNSFSEEFEKLLRNENTVDIEEKITAGKGVETLSGNDEFRESHLEDSCATWQITQISEPAKASVTQIEYPNFDVTIASCVSQDKSEEPEAECKAATISGNLESGGSHYDPNPASHEVRKRLPSSPQDIGFRNLSPVDFSGFGNNGNLGYDRNRYDPEAESHTVAVAKRCKYFSSKENGFGGSSVIDSSVRESNENLAYDWNLNDSDRESHEATKRFKYSTLKEDGCGTLSTTVSSGLESNGNIGYGCNPSAHEHFVRGKDAVIRNEMDDYADHSGSNDIVPEYLEVSPPHPLIADGIECFNSSDDRPKSLSPYLGQKAPPYQDPVLEESSTPLASEWKKLLTPNFYGEVRKIVNNVIDETMLSTTQKMDYSDTIGSWKNLEKRVLSQEPTRKVLHKSASQSQKLIGFGGSDLIGVGGHDSSTTELSLSKNASVISKRNPGSQMPPKEDIVNLNSVKPRTGNVCAVEPAAMGKRDIDNRLPGPGDHNMILSNTQKVFQREATPPKNGPLLMSQSSQSKFSPLKENKVGSMKRALLRNLATQSQTQPTVKNIAKSSPKAPYTSFNHYLNSHSPKERPITSYYSKIGNPHDRDTKSAATEKRNTKSSACKTLLDQLQRAVMQKNATDASK